MSLGWARRRCCTRSPRRASGFNILEGDGHESSYRVPFDLLQQLGVTNVREITHFARADGSNWHCEPMGRAEAECRMFDFLQDRIDQTR